MKFAHTLLAAAGMAAAFAAAPARADNFTEQDLEIWQSEFQSAVARGREVFTDPKLGSNGVTCNQCHPNGANIHPETYPKFQKQLGKVIVMAEMINWCILNPLKGDRLDLNDPRMVAIQAYITYERRGIPLEAGKH